MTRLHDLAALGQSAWLDYIRRALLLSGELADLIAQGLRGLTFSPTILEKAIVGSNDYDQALYRLGKAGRSPPETYEALVLEEIGRTADLFRPLYEAGNGLDGYVSLEVNPDLAHDTAAMVAEARRLYTALGRPNVMLKVPATPEGIAASEALIAAGVPVNATLLFSLEAYRAAAEAYIAGLERRAAAGGDLARVASLASFFVSRVDQALDAALERIGSDEARSLQGKIAIANARLAYALFQELFSGPRWESLAAQGAQVQRLLWADTGTKNSLYPDTLYVDSLIGPHTVNAMPLTTLQAFLDHGTVAPTLEGGLEEAREQVAQLARLGIDLDEITRDLQQAGVAAFVRSFHLLLEGIALKQERLRAGWEPFLARLGGYEEAVETALRRLDRDRVVRRIWAHDHTVWKPEPTEISNRLGWLHAPERMQGALERLTELVAAVRADGYTEVLLLGMGGSSLAPALFAQVWGQAGGLPLTVLDSTDPGAVLAQAERLDPARTLVIVATKSGRTVETLSLLRYFYTWMVRAVGWDRAGDHFIAITDPGSPLVGKAKQFRFRTTFLNDPQIGGRYAALSFFGLVPAALVGVDVGLLLERSFTAACACDACVGAAENQGVRLGAVLGELARAGRDKLTLLVSPTMAALGDWIEQLVAESTGKEGRGLLPVVGEPPGPPEVYGADRFFVQVLLEGEASSYVQALETLAAAGHPWVQLRLHNPYDLGLQFFLWEMGTAVAGHLLDINPFDQPNVEASKVLAREMVAAYLQEGALPAVDAFPPRPEVLAGFLAQGRPGDYIALQAYLRPTPETDAALQALRLRLRDRYHLATTVGYGPRFLHSTGQLHKGDRGNGLFVQFTADDPRDAPIPDQVGSEEASLTFGVLKAAQALGDLEALRQAGRRVVRLHLGADAVEALRAL